MFSQGHHLLSIEQLSLSDIRALFATAQKLEDVAAGRVKTELLRGAILANLFFEASTRTRMSFHSAFARLGGDICDTTGFSFSSISKGESLADTARVVSCYADVIVMRHPDKGAVAEFAEYATVPVINGGDGPGEHPTQALLDLFTIEREFSLQNKLLSGSIIAMTGDLKNGRTVHSLSRLLALFDNLTFHFISPNALPMPASIIEHLQACGHRVRIFTSPEKGIADADVIYATRIQKERLQTDTDASTMLSDGFCIDKKLMQSAKPDAIVLHPLPRDTRAGAFDLTTDFDDDPRLKIFTQAANGIPVRMALFVHCLGLEHEVGNDFRPNAWAASKRIGGR